MNKFASSLLLSLALLVLLSGCSGSYFRRQGNGSSGVGDTPYNSVSSKTVEKIGTIGLAEAPAGIKGKIVDFSKSKDVVYDVVMNHKSKDREYSKYYFQEHKPDTFLLIHYNDFVETGSVGIGCEGSLSMLGTVQAMKDALKGNTGIQLSGNVFKYYTASKR